jgi:serine/threonine protein kinase
MTSQPRYRKGDRIGGRYLVHQALLGGMGEIHLCLDLKQNYPFALKTIQTRYLTRPDMRKLFEKEVMTWVSLEKHSHIVRCFHLEFIHNQRQPGIVHHDLKPENILRIYVIWHS